MHHVIKTLSYFLNISALVFFPLASFLAKHFPNWDPKGSKQCCFRIIFIVVFLLQKWKVPSIGERWKETCRSGKTVAIVSMIELIKNCNYIWDFGYVLHNGSVRNGDCSLHNRKDTLVNQVVRYDSVWFVLRSQQIFFYVIVSFNLDNLNRYFLYFKRGHWGSEVM